MLMDDYLPTTLILDKGTAFMSHVLKGVVGVLSITLKHATTKHAQTTDYMSDLTRQPNKH